MTNNDTTKKTEIVPASDVRVGDRIGFEGYLEGCSLPIFGVRELPDGKLVYTLRVTDPFSGDALSPDTRAFDADEGVRIVKR